MEARPVIAVTVVFALPERATEIALRLPPGATLGHALDRSGLAARHPDIDFNVARVGIFGKLADRGSVLADGDRVEVYRPLTVDPKKARLGRAASRRKTGAK
jgi:putative ubiquitin-RnfH superfamily antitoxin RatB of RatAB toxin-antitoxin module